MRLRIAYHVAPRELRCAIRSQGIDYRLCHLRSLGNYLFGSLEDAMAYARDSDAAADVSDIHAVDITGYHLEPDPFREITQEPYFGSSVFTNEPIPADRLGVVIRGRNSGRSR